MSAEVVVESGCTCPPGACPGASFAGVKDQKKCVRFIARTRGPITLGPCKCVGNGRSYHDRDGTCLRCKGSGEVAS